MGSQGDDGFIHHVLWLYPTRIQALDMREDSVEHNKEQIALKGRWFGPFVIGSTIVILLLAAYGFYIIEYIA